MASKLAKQKQFFVNLVPILVFFRGRTKPFFLEACAVFC